MLVPMMYFLFLLLLLCMVTSCASLVPQIESHFLYELYRHVKKLIFSTLLVNQSRAYKFCGSSSKTPHIIASRTRLLSCCDETSGEKIVGYFSATIER